MTGGLQQVRIAATASCAAALPPNEAERLAALRTYGILDTEREPAFDDIARIAAHVWNAPIAVVNLIDNGRQWFKAEIGLGVRQTPLDTSICAHAILQPGILVVPDTLEDRRFADNPLVTGEPRLRFYAGALLQTPEGFPLGTVCVLDHRPRTPTEAQKEILRSLARQVMALLELRRTLTVMERLNRYRSRVMAEVGHDLKQPLQIVMMLLDLIEGELSGDANRRRVERIGAALDKVGSGLDALAEASRLVIEHATPRRAIVPVEPIIAKIVDGWHHHAEKKGLRLRWVRSSARIATDPAMMTTILANLVGNAIKYTDSGGVLVGCRQRGQTLAISVVDTGRGIPADRLDDIFVAFNQLDRHSEGLGLGLSIVRSTAETLDHPIGARSIVGRGSSFTVEAPIVGHAAPTEEHRPGIRLRGAGGEFRESAIG